MALVDTLVAAIRAEVNIVLARTQSDPLFSGRDRYDHRISRNFTEGTSTTAFQATGAFTAEFSVTTSSNIISLADSADPLGGLGDDVPSSDPEGARIRAILLENLDPVNGGNFITVGRGTNAIVAEILGGAAGATFQCTAGGLWLWVGVSSLIRDGTDDEITLQADTSAVDARLTYLFSV